MLKKNIIVFYWKKAENSSSANNLSTHYEWHLLRLRFLQDLPKKIHQTAKPQQSKKELQPPAKSEAILKIKTDDYPQPTSLSITECTTEVNVASSNSENIERREERPFLSEISTTVPFAPLPPPLEKSPLATESKEVDIARPNPEDIESKEEIPLLSKMPSWRFFHSSISFNPPNQEITNPSGASSKSRMDTYTLNIFALKKNAHKKMRAILLEIVAQKIFEQVGLFSSISHLCGLSNSKRLSSSRSQIDNENYLFVNWLKSFYKDFNIALRKELPQSLPEHIDLSNLKHFSMPIMMYFQNDDHRHVAIYSVIHSFFTKRYFLEYEAEECIDYYTNIGYTTESYHEAVETLEYMAKYKRMIVALMKQDPYRQRIFSMNYREAENIIAIYGQYLIEHHMPITFEKYQELITKKENLFSQVKYELYYKVAEKVFDALPNGPSASSLMQISSRMTCIIAIIKLAPYDIVPEDSKKTADEETQEKHIPVVLQNYCEKLEELIIPVSSTNDSAAYLISFNAEAMLLQNILSDLVGESIHYTWHSKFLTNLCTMVTFLLGKEKNELPSSPVIHDSSSSTLGTLSSHPSSFHVKNRQENRSPSIVVEPQKSYGVTTHPP